MSSKLLRNSNADFGGNAEDKDNLASKQKARRISASLLQSSIIQGTGNKKNFTSITPYGLPGDLVGYGDDLVERQNALIEPKGRKNEDARLATVKPFKTIEDEDNIHLLPTETGERVRMNLLDAKAVTKKDVDEAKKAYYTQRELHPELYSKQQAPAEEEQGKDDPKKKGFFKKLFSKKKKPESDHGPEPEPEVPPPEEPPKEEPPPPEPEKPLEKKEPSVKTTVSKSKSTKSKPSKDSDKPSSSEYETSSSEGSSSDDEGEMQNPYYPYGYGYGYQGYPQYAGFPGGYSPYFNQAYAGGFGPMQGPPCYNPCMEEIQLECCKKLLREKGERDSEQYYPKKKKQQGLNFDFLPHDDLATEVTMIIEPDEPEPLQYAVENGVMPIICCYMPSSIAVQPGQLQQQYSPSQSVGYPASTSGSPRTSYVSELPSQTSSQKRAKEVSQAGSNASSGTNASLPASEASTAVSVKPIDVDDI